MKRAFTCRRAGEPCSRPGSPRPCHSGRPRFAMLARAAELKGGGLLGPRPTHHEPRAKRLIVIFLTGGFSHVDTFDHKPSLSRNHGKPVPSFGLRPDETAKRPLMGSPFRFSPARPVGPLDQRAFPQPGRAGRRPVRDPHAAHRHRRAFPGRAGDAHRLGHGAAAQPGSLAELRARHVQREPAVVHGAVRAPALRRLAGVGQQFPAADPSGRADRPGRRADPRPASAGPVGVARASSSGRCCATSTSATPPRDLTTPNLRARMASFDVARGMMREAPEVFDVQSRDGGHAALYGVPDGDTKSFA